MDESILNSTKKILGVDPGDTSFDLDIITHINSSFSVLNDLGIGPVNGYAIEDEADVWADIGITSVPMLNLLKTCIYLQVRMLFDPPVTSYLQAAFKAQIDEHIWRLSEMRENVAWVDPDPPPLGEAA
jgi:hypothetical protein